MHPSLHDLEQFVRGEATPAQVESITAACRDDPALRARVEQLRAEQRLIQALRASSAIRAPDNDELEIITRLAARLSRDLAPGRLPKDRDGD